MPDESFGWPWDHVKTPDGWPPCHKEEIVGEVLRGRIYDGVPIGGVVVDAGANVGVITSVLRQEAQHVYAIEADPVVYAVLDDNRKRLGWDNVSTHCFALAGYSGFATLYRTARDPLISSITQLWEGESVRVPAITLDSFMDEFGIERIDLLKLDIEGAEAGILLGDTFPSAASRISRILVECHRFPDGYSAPLDRLVTLGFREVIRLPQQTYLPAMHLYEKEITEHAR